MLDSRNQGPEWHGKVQQGNSGDLPSGPPDRRGAPCDQRARRTADADTPPSGVRGAGRTSLCSSPWSRDLRSNRKTHPDPADRQAT